MISKKHPIEILEEALKYEREQLENCQKSIKSMRNQAAKDESSAMKCIARISGLEDALHKLNGLDNLEKKNKEPCWRRPDSMTNNLLRTETAKLYGRSITSFSLRELAAYIIHQADRIKELLERK